MFLSSFLYTVTDVVTVLRHLGANKNVEFNEIKWNRKNGSRTVQKDYVQKVVILTLSCPHSTAWLSEGTCLSVPARLCRGRIIFIYSCWCDMDYLAHARVLSWLLSMCLLYCCCCCWSVSLKTCPACHPTYIGKTSPSQVSTAWCSITTTWGRLFLLLHFMDYQNTCQSD